MHTVESLERKTECSGAGSGVVRPRPGAGVVVPGAGGAEPRRGAEAVGRAPSGGPTSPGRPPPRARWSRWGRARRRRRPCPSLPVHAVGVVARRGAEAVGRRAAAVGAPSAGRRRRAAGTSPGRAPTPPCAPPSSRRRSVGSCRRRSARSCACSTAPARPRSRAGCRRRRSLGARPWSWPVVSRCIVPIRYDGALRAADDAW